MEGSFWRPRARLAGGMGVWLVAMVALLVVAGAALALVVSTGPDRRTPVSGPSRSADAPTRSEDRGSAPPSPAPSSGSTSSPAPSRSASPVRPTPSQTTEPAGPTVVRLSEPTYRDFDPPDLELVQGGWGSGARAFGVHAGSGPASMRVAGDGSVVVLDQHNRRFVRVAPGSARRNIPVVLDFGCPDFAVGEGAVAYVVLDRCGAGGNRARVAAFGEGGGQPTAALVVDQVGTKAALRVVDDSAYVRAYAASGWRPVIKAGRALSPAAQRAGERAELPPDTAGPITVAGVGARSARIRVMLDDEPREYLIQGAAMANVLFAEVIGGSVVLVVSQFDDRHAQFHLLELDDHGVVRDRTLPRQSWAASNPDSMFRAGDGVLYQTLSTSSGYRVVGYRLAGAGQD